MEFNAILDKYIEENQLKMYQSNAQGHHQNRFKFLYPYKELK